MKMKHQKTGKVITVKSGVRGEDAAQKRLEGDGYEEIDPNETSTQGRKTVRTSGAKEEVKVKKNESLHDD